MGAGRRRRTATSITLAETKIRRGGGRGREQAGAWQCLGSHPEFSSSSPTRDRRPNICVGASRASRSKSLKSRNPSWILGRFVRDRFLSLTTQLQNLPGNLLALFPASGSLDQLPIQAVVILATDPLGHGRWRAASERGRVGFRFYLLYCVR